MRRWEAGYARTASLPPLSVVYGAGMALLQYKLKIRDERVGSPEAGLSLQIESLDNLNETIDELFVELERRGNPALLEELCPYFGVVWPSARALSEVLWQEGGAALQGKRLLEVGCGLALPSFVAARLGAQVVATDFHPDIPLFFERNARLNELEGRLRFVSRDWQADGSGLGLFDWVVGSDILYERQHPGPVAKMLARHVAPGGRVLLADPGRPYLQAFADEMRALGFGCQVHARNVQDTPARKDIFVLELRELRAGAGRNGVR